METVNPDIIRDAIELTLLPAIGLLLQDRIWKSFPGISDFFSADMESLASLGLGPEISPLLQSRAYQAKAAEIYDWGIREGCRFLVRGYPGYPRLLDEIFAPPLVLYVRGCLDVLQAPCIAVVGTRKPTIYGLQMAQGIAFDLAEKGFAIVSGLARGIDGAAHRGCLQAGGKTVAVLGCGIDVVYPKEHRQLMQQILQQGLVVSEFPPGTPPAPRNFPVRNRLISGLALGTVIIEARECSGSLITARLAMEQNREVFALPGNITSPPSFGPNFLIKQGAKLVQSWRDIVEEMPPDLRSAVLQKEDMDCSSRVRPDPLSPEEARIFNLLKPDEVTQFDQLYRSSGLDISELNEKLLSLEMRGWIRQLPGNLYVRIHKPLN